MRIREIIKEDQEDPSRYEKLNAFRKFKSGPSYDSSRDFGDDVVTVPNTITKSSTRQLPATTSKIPDVKPEINDKLRSIFRQMFKDFEKSAAEQNRVPLFSIYKAGDDPTKGTFGLSTKTDNNVKVGIGSGLSGEIKYYDIDEKDKDRRAAMMEVLTNLGFKYLPTGSKFRFEVKNPNDLQLTFSDFWKMVNEIESLGNDFKSRSSSSSGAGSLITGKQAPIQYYLWIAKNIYESNKNNASWGFSRGGGDGAYDKFDNVLIIGITKGGIKQQEEGRPAYREHVVPADLINRMGIEICKKYPKTEKYRKQVISEVAKMIHRNLAIVLCSSPPKDSNGNTDKNTKESTEQEIIDSKFRTSMPPGWKDGDSILARFEYFDIPVYKNKTSGSNSDNGKRIAEDD